MLERVFCPFKPVDTVECPTRCPSRSLVIQANDLSERRAKYIHGRKHRVKSAFSEETFEKYSNPILDFYKQARKKCVSISTFERYIGHHITYWLDNMRRTRPKH